MKQLKQFLSLFLVTLLSVAKLNAQIVEGTPCTAVCLDPTKSTITGKNPNPDGVSPNLHLPCGSGTSEDNPAWWIIRPSGNKLTYTVQASNCVGGGLGIQMTLWEEGDNCGSLSAIDCVVGTSGVLTANVTPCKIYYLQVDGMTEAQCNLTITYDKNQILKEVPAPTITGPMQLCKGATAKFTASLPSLPGCRPDSWTWTIEPANAAIATKVAGSPDDINIKITNPPPSGKVKVCVEPKFTGKCLPKVNKQCKEIDIIDLKPATCDVTLYPEDLPYTYSLFDCIKTTNPTFLGAITPKTYTINFPSGTNNTQKITYSVDGTDCASDVTLNVKILTSNPLTFDIEDNICGAKDQVLEIPVRVKNFNKIGNFQMSIVAQDTNIATITGITSAALNVNSALVNGGITNVLWFDSDGVGKDLADNAIVFYVKVKLKGAVNTSAVISFSSTPIQIQAEAFVNGNLTAVTPYTLNGSVCILRSLNICGKIKREDNIGIANVLVKLSNNTGVIKSSTTDNLGNYCFNSVLVSSDSLIIEPQKVDNPKNGVTSGDLFRIQSHILGSSLLDTKYKMLAADVNNSSSIATSDIFRIQQLILGKIAKFSDVNSWEFVPANYSLGTNPFSPVAPKKLVVSTSQNINNADFIGYKMGDVNNSNTPTANPVSNTRAAKEVVFKASSQTTDVGKEIDVKVSASSFSQMIATQFSMKWDSSVLQFKSLGGFNSAMLLENANFTTDEVTSGRLGFLWFDEKAKTVTLPNDATIFTIKFKVIGGEKTNSIVSFDSIPVGISSENIDETLITVFEKGTIQVNAIIDTKDNVANQVAIKVYPNPVNHVLNVDLSSVSSAQITVELLDASGKQLRKMEGLPSNKIATIDMSDLPNQVYFLKVKSNNELLHIEKVLKKD